MMDNDKEFDDLIQYASDDDDNNAEEKQQNTEEASPKEKVITADPEEIVIDTGLSKEEEEELDRYEMSKTNKVEDEEIKHQGNVNLKKIFVIASIVVVFVMVFLSFGRSFIS